jgi:uncharacterized membrane protein YeaQ/YmgE (transglycosylase-associated protein family)
MPLFLVFLLILFVLALFWLTGQVIGVIATLVIAGLVGAIADSIVPGDIPFGWLGSILAGLVGSWLGVWIFDAMNIGAGPNIFGIPIIPAFVGAVILAFVASLFSRSAARGRSI